MSLLDQLFKPLNPELPSTGMNTSTTPQIQKKPLFVPISNMTKQFISGGVPAVIKNTPPPPTYKQAFQQGYQSRLNDFSMRDSQGNLDPNKAVNFAMNFDFTSSLKKVGAPVVKKAITSITENVKPLKDTTKQIISDEISKLSTEQLQDIAEEKFYRKQNPKTKFDRAFKWFNDWIQSATGRGYLDTQYNPPKEALEFYDKLEYKPTKPITVYRAISQGQKSKDYDNFTSWTTDKQMASNFLLDDGKVISKIVSPDEVLLEFDRIPYRLRPEVGEDFLGDTEHEVILKPIKEILENRKLRLEKEALKIIKPTKIKIVKEDYSGFNIPDRFKKDSFTIAKSSGGELNIAGKFGNYTQPTMKFDSYEEALKYVNKKENNFEIIKEITPPKTFQGLDDLSTKLLQKFKGMPEEINEQQFKEVINRVQKEGIKKADLDLVNEMAGRQLQTGKLNLTKLAQDVQTQLVPLKPTQVKSPRYSSTGQNFIGDGKYGEIVYESPIKTSAGDVHYRHVLGRDYNKSNPPFPNYFSHIRYEDMADGKTRKILETQSDLFQKGNFAREMFQPMKTGDIIKDRDIMSNAKLLEQKLSKLQPYSSNDPLAHLRTFREEVKRAAKDGKDTLLIPSGETAMKIEGLGQIEHNWMINLEKGAKREPFQMHAGKLTPDKLKVGMSIDQSGEGYANSDWIITDILGDGKFKAVPKEQIDRLGGIDKAIQLEKMHTEGRALARELNSETFDISGKVDTKHFVYKLNEEAIPREARKMGLEVEKLENLNTKDDFLKTTRPTVPGSWWKIKIPKERAKFPVEAFGGLPLLGLPFLGDKEEKKSSPLIKKKSLFNKIADVVYPPSVINYKREEETSKQKEQTIKEPIRQIEIKPQELNTLTSVLFGEVSNREPEKMKMEAKAIINIALNRAKQWGKTLEEILSQPNQFQAYKGKEFQKATSSKLDYPSQKKMNLIKEVIEELKLGKLKNTVDNSIYYIHTPDSRLFHSNKYPVQIPK